MEQDDDVGNNNTNEWELSKENVQPLKKGRILSHLTTGLQHSGAEMAKLREKQHAFEYRLRMYNGDDPLGVWYCYIQWIQQNFPSGGPETGLQTLLENCITKFKDVEKYKNDERFVEVWLNLVAFQVEPLELFKFMMNKGIGVNVAAFYSAWADELEIVGNYKNAESIYQAGLSRMAYPVQNLRSRYADFQQRAIKVAGIEAASEMVEVQRQSLSSVKGQGKHKVASNDRQPIEMVKPMKTPLVVSNDQKFTIFSDKANDMSSQVSIKSDWASVPKQAKMQAENVDKPAQWTKSKIAKKAVSTAVPISEVSKLQNPNFSVHVDQNSLATTSGKSLSIGVLSERKAEKPVSAHDIVNRVTDSPGKKAMYQKSKVYGGVVELSFEEIRARGYFERRRIRKEIETLVQKQLEEQHIHSAKQLKELQEQVHRLTVEIMQQKTSASSTSAAGLPSHRQSPTTSMGIHQQQLQTQEPDLPIVSQKQPPALQQKEQYPQPEVQEPHRIAIKPQSQPIRNIGFDLEARKFVVKTPTLAFVAEDSKLEVPNNSTNDVTPNKSAGPNSSGDRTTASLTMNTKEAMHVIQDMFNHTLRADDLGFDDDASDILENSRFGMKPGVQPTDNFLTKAAFQIFTDSDDKDSAGSKPGVQPTNNFLTKAAFQIFTDSDDKDSAGMGGAFKIYKEPSQAESFRLPIDDLESLPTSAVPGADLEGFLPIDEEMTFAPPMGSTQKYPGLPQGQLDEEMTFNPCYAPTKIFTPVPRAAQEPTTFCGDKSQSQSQTPAIPLQNGGAPEPSPQRFAATTNAFNLSTIAEGSNEKSVSSSDHDTTNHFCGHTIPTSHLDTNKTDHTSNSGFPEIRSLIGHIDDKFIGLVPTPNQREPSISDIDDDLNKLIGLEPTPQKRDLSISKSVRNLSVRQNGNTTRNEASFSRESVANSLCESRFSASCLESSKQHIIDTSHYIPSHAHEDLLSQTIAIDPGLNPFDDDVTEDLLAGLEIPVTEFAGYVQIADPVPNFPDKGHDAIVLGEEIYHVERKIGSGAFASVYLASKLNNEDFEDVSGTDDKRAIKVQRPACPWEFYIISTLHIRLRERLVPVDVRPSVMTVDKAIFYADGSCLINQFHPNGTLLNLVNSYKAAAERLPENFVAYIVVELLYVVEALIKCGMIHGDLKPDNVLFLGPPSLTTGSNMAEMMGGKTQSIKLVDFGRGIDLKLFPDGTNFTAKVDTSGFQCIEMQTDQAWTHQTDLFGLVGTVHVLIFNQYMNVHNARGRWRTTGKIPRRWDAPMWDKLFDQLLNIENCQNLPDISSVRKPFEDFLISKSTSAVCLLPDWHLQ